MSSLRYTILFLQAGAFYVTVNTLNAGLECVFPDKMPIFDLKEGIFDII